MHRIAHVARITALLALCLGSACSVSPLPEKKTATPPTKNPTPAPTAPAVPAIAKIHPAHDAAVLFFEDNFDFAGDNAFTGGPAVYSNQVFGLTALLRQRGIDAHTELIPPTYYPLSRLQRFRALYIIDTYLIRPAFRDRLAAYVRAGGLLVGICEVGRYQDEWVRPWPFADIFGLQTRPIDPYATGVSFAPDPFYRFARILEPATPLLAGLDDRIDWGASANKIWGTDPNGARVLAVFTQYLARAQEDGDTALQNDTIPALTLHRFGEGTAVFAAARPTDERTGSWAGSADAGRILAQAMTLAGDAFLPGHEPDIRVTAGLNQLGYEPAQVKEVVLRIEGGPEHTPLTGDFTLRAADGDVLLGGPLQTWTGRLWRSRFLTANLTPATREGVHDLEVAVPPLGLDFHTNLIIRAHLLEEKLLPSQLNFFHQMRSGFHSHTNDPVRGGFMDAGGDWAVRMWSMPHVIWGITRYLESNPANTAWRAELAWGLDWCLGMQAPDGGVYAAVRSPDGQSPIHIRPARDKTQRIVDRTYSFNYTATYAAALARAARRLARRDERDENARCLRAAQRAFARIQKDPVTSTADLGNRVWAATELSQTTADPRYLTAVRGDLEQVLARQIPPGRVVDGPVYGDFFADPDRTTFSPQQWKVFHSIGIYLGLVQAEQLLSRADPLQPRITAALDAFVEGYLLGMSSLTPYGQMANGLEPAGPGAFRVFFFSHKGAWVRNHGLNCDMLAMALLGLERTRGNDPRLRRLAERQLNWLLGANPLGYCMVDGLCANRAPMIAEDLGTGPIRGGIPNGIIGRGPDNLPAWGAGWGSREYWLPHNAYLLALLGALTH